MIMLLMMIQLSFSRALIFFYLDIKKRILSTFMSLRWRGIKGAMAEVRRQPEHEADVN